MTTAEINFICKTKDLTHKKLAELIGEERSFVSQVITYNRKSGPAVRRCRLKIAMRLKKQVEEIFDDAEPVTKEESKATRRRAAA